MEVVGTGSRGLGVLEHWGCLCKVTEKTLCLEGKENGG